MPTATATPTTGNGGLSNVIDAMRSVQTESDRWQLAEALRTLIPEGASGFDRIIDKATQEGVVGNLSANTLRLYRDTAKRWDGKRVPNVSFSAHREAMVLNSIDDGAKMLRDIAKTLGPDKVTVASVRKAVAVKQGKAAPAAAQSGTPTSSTLFPVLADLRQGGKQLVAAIPASTPSSELDEIHDGLSKVLAHVERLRSKAAQKRTASKAPAPAPKAEAKPKAEEAPKAPTSKKPAGDLRGL